MTAIAVPTVTARRVPVWSVVVAAPLIALVVWVLADPVAGVALAAGDPPVDIGPAAVAIVSVLAALAAWGVRSLFFRQRRTGWFVVCGAVLVVSLLGPLGAGSGAAALWLALMHVAVAAVVVPGLAPGRPAA
ncbi:DUF6069 family protein [Cellulomonas sp. McL0617]|uniref:DUF6069 family protein n=1 Tax=Cellulomonas sp. McL0617 TaxID=3415675 RepID=UPI003CF267A6